MNTMRERDPWDRPPTTEQLAIARATAAQAQRDALSDVLGDALTCADAAARIGTTAASVRARIRRGELTAIKDAGRWHLPAWQFGTSGPLPGLPELIAAWPGTPLALSVWAMTPNADLRGGQALARALRAPEGPRGVLKLVAALSASAW